MPLEIYFLSGTGNSLFMARELKKRLPGAALIPIAALLERGEHSTQGNAVGFVFPVHALTIPLAVKRFLRQADLSSADYVFAVATRKNTKFYGFKLMDRLLRRQKKRLHAHFVINMYSNETRHEGYAVPAPEDIKQLEDAALDKLNEIADIVENRRACREPDTGVAPEYLPGRLRDRLLDRVVLGAISMSEHLGGVNYFYRDGKCTGCGICQRVCLSQKIVPDGKKPVWQRNTLCYMCFACLNFCPARAVQIKSIPGVRSYTKENGRYPHPYASVADMEAQRTYLDKA